MSELHDPAVLEALRDLFDDVAGDDASASLAAFGVWDLIHADRMRAVQLVFHEQGRAGASSDTFNTLQQTVLEDHFPGLNGTVALTTSAKQFEPLVSTEDSTATGAVYAFGKPARLVICGSNGITTHLAVVDVARHGVSIDPIHGIDQASILTRVTLDHAPIEVVALADSARKWWIDALAWGRLALAWEVLGGASTALKTATTYAQTRVQFGSPIGVFQAVKHRLAETLVAIEAAQAILELPQVSINPLVASMAKAAAGQAYTVTAKNCLQVFGGIGFTAEHPFDSYLRRGMWLDRMLGSSAKLTESLGEHLLEYRSVPSLCGLQSFPLSQ